MDGITYWKDALMAMPRSIRLRGVGSKMLNPEGEILDIYENESVTKVQFDKKFVFWVITERFLKPLGLIGKEDYLRDVFFPELVEYVATEGSVSQERELYNLAKQLSRYNGKTFEENLQLIRSSNNNNDVDDDYNYYEPNGKEEKLTAVATTGKKKTA
jgi:hypothetical protein